MAIRMAVEAGQYASCHQPPYYTDNLMHDLKNSALL
jgi:hypothetical protein